MSPFEYLYYWSLSCISIVDSILLSRPDKSKRFILCYHSVSNSSWRFAITPALFETHLKALQHDYEIVPLKTLLSSKKISSKPMLALTFDDGYQDTLTTAAPLLRKLGLTGTTFVIGGKANRTELGNDLPLLKMSEIKKLKNDFGWEVGYHTDTHADLSQATPVILTREILTGKQKLEKELGFGLKYFAYPRGYYDQKVAEIVKQAGFEHGLTVNGTQVNQKNPYVTDRINIEGKLTAWQLRALLSPIGVASMSLLTRCLQIKEYFIAPHFL